MFVVTYEEALKEARKKAKRFPTFKDAEGVEWIEIEGKRYPKEWFIRHAARMKVGGEL